MFAGLQRSVCLFDSLFRHACVIEPDTAVYVYEKRGILWYRYRGAKVAGRRCRDRVRGESECEVLRDCFVRRYKAGIYRFDSSGVFLRLYIGSGSNLAKLPLIRDGCSNMKNDENHEILYMKTIIL